MITDWTPYTPIYIRTTGDDGSGDGSLGNPYLTAQKGYDVAAPLGTPIVLDFGAGSFGIVQTTTGLGWPGSLGIRGLDAVPHAGTSNIAHITRDITATTASDGMFIISDNTITVGYIDNRGTDGLNGAASSGDQGTAGYGGGTVYLSSVAATNIYANGGNAGSGDPMSDSSGLNGGTGGTVDIQGSGYIGHVENRGGNGSSATMSLSGGSGGPGGVFTATNSTFVETSIDVRGGNGASAGSTSQGGQGGNGGTVSITNCTVNVPILTSGGNYGYSVNPSYGGNGGNIVITGSNIGDYVQAYGGVSGGGDYVAPGPFGGTIYIENCNFTNTINIATVGGAGNPGGNSGLLNVINCVYSGLGGGNIIAAGGTGMFGSMEYQASGGGSNTVTLTNVTFTKYKDPIYNAVIINTSGGKGSTSDYDYGSTGSLNLTKVGRGISVLYSRSGGIYLKGVCALPMSQCIGTLILNQYTPSDVLGAGLVS